MVTVMVVMIMFFAILICGENRSPRFCENSRGAVWRETSVCMA